MRRKPHIFIGEMLVSLLMVIIVSTTFTQVISRYIFNYSLTWADELSRLSLVWIVLTGMVVCFVRGQHAVVGVFLDGYKGKNKLIATTLIDLLVFILFSIILFGGFRLMLMTWGQSTSGLGISRGMLYAALPVGASLMLIELATRLIFRFKDYASSK